MGYSFTHEFFVQAPPDEVLELLTNPMFVNDWSGGESLIEKKVGGKFVMFDGWVEGKILKITDKELAYTWKPNNWSENTAASEVYMSFREVLHGTEVLLEHTNIPSQEELDLHKHGWEQQFFGPIADYLGNRRQS